MYANIFSFALSTRGNNLHNFHLGSLDDEALPKEGVFIMERICLVPLSPVPKFSVITVHRWLILSNNSNTKVDYFNA